MEALLCFGAASCSIEDTNFGAPQEQEVLHLFSSSYIVLRLCIKSRIVMHAFAEIQFRAMRCLCTFKSQLVV